MLLHDHRWSQTERVMREAGWASMQLANILEVRTVIDEMIGDIEEAARRNDLSSLAQQLELTRLELQSTRFEAAELAEQNAAMTRERRLVTSSASKLREDVCREVLALRQARAAEEALKASQRESALEARKVPQLEKELSRCKRELAAATRRSSLLAATKTPEMTALERTKREKIGLLALEDKLLLKVFSFLSAWGVLASAQGDRGFFARVDVLFGMGSTVASSVASSVGPLADLTSRPTNSLNKSVLSESTASAIASKLNASEIKSILAVNERTRVLEAECISLRAEKEDLATELEGAESVKDFLAQKLRDTEAALATATQKGDVTARQRLSDQEVIAFLDTKARELEALASDARSRKDTVEAELTKQRDAAIAELQMLHEAALVENAGNEAADRAAKQQKKVLVREVKALRTQLAQVQQVANRQPSVLHN